MISKQERAIGYLWFTHLCYDHYLLSGSGFKQKVLNRHYHCQNFFAIGQPRASYIRAPKNPNRYRKYLDIKRTHKLVVCYGLNLRLGFTAKFEVGMYGQPCISEESCLDFLWISERLAKTFPECYFVVRFKNTERFKQSPYREVIERVQDIDNLEVTLDLSRHNSYQMAYLADIVIGKLTSILEECYVAGKPILFYDGEEHFIRSLDYVLNDSGLVTANYDELQTKLAAFLRGEPYCDVAKTEEIRRKYFSSEDGSVDGFKLIRQYVIQTLRSK